MRGVLLIAGIAAVLVVALTQPFAGVILWTWFTLQDPHQETYSFAQSLPLNLVLSIVTVGAWLMSGERKMPPRQFLVWAIAIFLAWTTFNSFFAFDPNWSWPYWDRTWKTFALGLLIAAMAVNRVRIHAIVWISVVSLFYYGVKGGVFTLVGGGINHVWGPTHSEIADNNALALALLMTLPLANYLRRQSANPWVAWGITGGMVLTVLSIFGTYSRGGLIGLGALATLGILRARRRFVYLSMAALAAVAALAFMPQSFWQRADTIVAAAGQGQYDKSVQGRFEAWQVAYRYAHDHFPLGAGFYASQLPGVYNTYFPDAKTTHAAHSIYFQVLGEHGFVGLLLYLLIVIGALWKCATVIRASRGRPELQWASDLGQMIQMSLIVFCVGGAALSMAYYDLFVILVALLVPLSEICTLAWPQTVPSGSLLVRISPSTA